MYVAMWGFSISHNGVLYVTVLHSVPVLAIRQLVWVAFDLLVIKVLNSRI